MKLDLSLQLGSRAVLQGAGPSYDPSAAVIFNAFTTPPTSARKTLINNAVVALKTSGAWALLDCLYVMAAADSQAARVNWKSPGTFTLSPVNSPAFTVDRGYTGDGAASYLSTGFTPSSAGGNFSLNSAHLGVWSRTDLNSTTACDMGGGTGTATSTLYSRNSGSFSGRLNDSSGGAAIVAVADSIGHSVVGRNDALLRRANKNGGAATTVSAASGAIANTTVNIGAGQSGTALSPRQIAEAHLGGGLTDAINLSIYNALLAYNQAVGAA